MIAKTIMAVVALPVTVTIVVPALLLYAWGFDPIGISQRGMGIGFVGLGIVFIAVGLFLLIVTNRMFFVRGKGTLAPWDPPKHLVVTGVYRHVRNPMISGVLFVLLGEALLFRSPALLVWFLIFFSVNSIYIPRLEEPQLADRFGEAYEAYCENVPRWIPRVTPWLGNETRS